MNRERSFQSAAGSALLLALLAAPGCSLQERNEGLSSFEAGKEAALSNDHATAINHFTLAIESSRDSYFFTEAHLERGDSHLALAEGTPDPLHEQSLKQALKDFDRVLAEPEITPAQRARALSSKGTALLSRDDVKGSEEAFTEILAAGEGAEGELRQYSLEAHRRLGEIAYSRAEEMRKETVSAGKEGLVQEQFREAQEHFSRGLEIDAEDWGLNLGKGMCLLFREQEDEAMIYLEKSTALSSARGVSNPRGYYYLARAIEIQKGFYLPVLEHYRKAITEDPSHSVQPLYEHIVEVLPVYLSPESAEFSWFLDQVLAHKPQDRKYWQNVEALATKISSGGPGVEQKLGTFTLAVAQARNGNLEEAVKNALKLQDQPDFLQFIFRIFPSHEKSTEYLYGRALTLFNAKKHEELESFFREEVFGTLEAAAKQTPEYQKTLVIEGRNIVALWAQESALTSPARDPEAKLERDKKLGRARDAFVAYLDRYAEEDDVRMALGEVQEMMESFPAAFVSYAFIADRRKDNDRAVLKILKLHKDKLLLEEVSSQAWNLLRRYAGENVEIKEYVSATRAVINAELQLYCKACGRKGAEGDRMCIECGRLIGKAGETGKAR